MSAKKYFHGVILFIFGAGIAIATNRFTHGLSWNYLNGGIIGGSGILSLVGLGFIIQAFKPEE